MTLKHRLPIHDNWETPADFYYTLNEEFHFNFDPCPLHPSFDGLSIEWGERNFVNPPYSRKLKEAFIKKAYEESQKGKLCILLLPVSTSTKVFHDFIYGKAEIRFIRGRLKFNGMKQSGQFDSMIVIYRGGGV